jgi:small-conductance mechanosensitive channel
MDELRQLLAELRSFDVQLFRLGNTDITLYGLVKLALLIAGLFLITGRIDQLLRKRVLERTRLDLPARLMLAAIVRYLMLVLGFLVILQTSGINITSLNVLAGALGVGVGFGLQNIVSNFMSGLIIMFERSIKVGDRVELGNIEGEVMEIGARRTTLLTNDNLTYIVPNSRFITENVANLH